MATLCIVIIYYLQECVEQLSPQRDLPQHLHNEHDLHNMHQQSLAASSDSFSQRGKTQNVQSSASDDINAQAAPCDVKKQHRVIDAGSYNDKVDFHEFHYYNPSFCINTFLPNFLKV